MAGLPLFNNESIELLHVPDFVVDPHVLPWHQPTLHPERPGWDIHDGEIRGPPSDDIVIDVGGAPLQVGPFMSNAHQEAIRDGDAPMPGGLHAVIGNSQFVNLVHGDPQDGPVTISIQAPITAMHLNTRHHQITRAALLAQVAGLPPGVVGRYAAHLPLTPMGPYMDDNARISSHNWPMHLVTKKNYSLRFTFQLEEDATLTMESIQRAIEESCQRIEANNLFNYVIVCNVSHARNYHTGVVIHGRDVTNLTSLRVLEGNGVCWLKALVTALGVHNHWAKPREPVIVAQMRTIHPKRMRWDPYTDGVTPLELVQWAQKYKDQYYASIYVNTPLGFIFCSYTHPEATTRVYMTMTSSTHVVLREQGPATNRSVQTGDMMMTSNSASLPEFIPDKTQIIFTPNIAHLLDEIKAIVIEPGTECIRIVPLTDHYEDLFDDLTPVLQQIALEAEQEEKLFVPHWVQSKPTGHITGLDNITAFYMYRNCMWIIDSGYADKQNLHHQIACSDYAAAFLDLPPTVNDFRSFPSHQRQLFSSLVGLLKADEFSDAMRKIMHANKGGALNQCLEAAPRNVELVEFDLPAAYSSVLYKLGDIPIFSILDDPRRFVPGEATAFFGRFYGATSPETAHCMPAGIYILWNPIHIPWSKIRVNSTVATREQIVYYLQTGILGLEGIHSYCAPSYLLPAKAFQPAIRHLFNVLGPKSAKSALNSTIGAYGIHEQNKIRVAFADVDLAQAMIADPAHVGDAHIAPLSNDKPDGMYMVTLKQKVEAQTSNLSIYQHVIGALNVCMLELLSDLNDAGVTVIGVATDAAIVVPDAAALAFAQGRELPADQPGYDAKRGSIRVKPQVKLQEMRFAEPTPRMPDDVLFSRISDNIATPTVTRLASADELIIWDQNPGCQGCIVLGPAGSGKTFALKQIMKTQEEKKPGSTLICSQTGLLCSQFRNEGLDARTFQYLITLFKRNNLVFGTRCRALAVLVVDEMYRMNATMLRILVWLRKRNPTLRIYLAGDPYQITGFEVSPDGINIPAPRYDELSTALAVVGHTTLTLKTNPNFCRFADHATYKAVEHLRDTQMLLKGHFTRGEPIDDSELGSMDIPFALTLTIAKRDAVNTAQMRRRAAQLEADDKSDDYVLRDEVGDPMWCGDQPIVTQAGFQTSLPQEDRDDPDEKEQIPNGMTGQLLIIPQDDDEPLLFFAPPDNAAYSITRAELDTHFMGGYASTIARFQGLRIDHPFYVFEGHRMRFDAFYTAVSRCVHNKNVILVPPHDLYNWDHTIFPKAYPWENTGPRTPTLAPPTPPCYLTYTDYQFPTARVLVPCIAPSIDKAGMNAAVVERIFTDCKMDPALTPGLTKRDLDALRELDRDDLICPPTTEGPFQFTHIPAARAYLRQLTTRLPRVPGQTIIGHPQTNASIYDPDTGRMVPILASDSGAGGFFDLVNNELDAASTSTKLRGTFATRINGSIDRGGGGKRTPRIGVQVTTYKPDETGRLQKITHPKVRVRITAEPDELDAAWEEVAHLARTGARRDRCNLVARPSGVDAWKSETNATMHALFAHAQHDDLRTTRATSLFVDRDSESDEDA